MPLCPLLLHFQLQGGLDFQNLLEQHPDAVMEYIVKHGTKLLGTFKCKVTVIPHLHVQGDHCVSSLVKLEVTTPLRASV